jgi:hypothetical protein
MKSITNINPIFQVDIFSAELKNILANPTNDVYIQKQQYFPQN